MWKSIFFIFFFCAFDQVVMAAEPLSVKGVSINASIADVKQKMGTDLSCSTAKFFASDGQMCYRNEYGSGVTKNYRFTGDTYAGKNVKIYFLLHEGRVKKILVSDLAPNDFDGVLSALKEKFGNPSALRSEPFETVSGVKRDNAIAEWRAGDAILTTARYGESLFKMKLVLDSIDDAKRQSAEIDAKAKSDL